MIEQLARHGNADRASIIEWTDRVMTHTYVADAEQMDRSERMQYSEISSSRASFPDLLDAWSYRSLLMSLVRRNLKIRYVHTVFGSAWSVIQPLMTTGLLTIVFGLLLAVPSDGVPYGVFALGGMAVWYTVNRTLNETATSFAGSGGLILKVYFPRILLPISAALTAAVDAVPIYATLLAISIAYGQFPGWPILLSPMFLVIALLLAFALGLTITVIDVVIRDVRMLIPAGMQIVFYLTPVLYSDSVIPHKWVWLYRLNPFYGIVKAFRWSMMVDAPPPAIFDILWVCGFSLATLVFGLLMFARFESYAVDRI